MHDDTQDDHARETWDRFLVSTNPIDCSLIDLAASVLNRELNRLLTDAATEALRRPSIHERAALVLMMVDNQDQLEAIVELVLAGLAAEGAGWGE